MNTDSQPARTRNAALIFIFITVLIDVLSFGLIIPVLPHLVQEFVGGSIAEAAIWVGIFGMVFAVIQFISSPVQGALSDRYGRRPVILISCLGLGLDFVFMALAPNLAWLFVGRIIAGVCGASWIIASAFIADVTTPDERAKAYGLMGAAFGVALLGIYILVVAQFGSFRLPLVILTPIPLTFLGIMAGHWIFDAPFSATSMIGFIALAGIIVRNSILLVDFIRNSGTGKVTVDVLIEAGAIRFKPILLTAIAAMIGAVVILADPIFQGLAISLLFGLLSSTLLTVLVIPAIYRVFKT